MQEMRFVATMALRIMTTVIFLAFYNGTTLDSIGGSWDTGPC